jgi:hypothetical protein
MNDEHDNPPVEAGTDNVTPQADDTSEDWDYFDPDEDQDTEAVTEEAETDDGTGATDEEATPDETPAEVEAAHDAVVTMADGSKMKVADLIQGQLRQSDYTRKAQEVATQRKTLETESKRLESISQAFIDHLSSLVPDAPEAALAYQDPAKFMQQKAIHEAALAKVQELVKIGEQPKAIADGLTKQQRAEKLAEENRMLAEKFPATAQREGRDKFFSDVAATAEQVGFSLDELGSVTDHRIFAALHYATLGMKAERAREAARAKVSNVPPVAPKRPGQGAKAPTGNAEAMKRLNRSGSIRDALAIDWE